MDGWSWLLIATPTLAAMVPTGRELLAFLRTRRWTRVVEQVVDSAKPGTRVRVDADGAFDLSFDPAVEEGVGDPESSSRTAQ